ncbi:pyruvate, phosphate dikinase [Amylibacter kogurei]|uniref:Pyruvate, phosphate dikinase n=1 Tax=Paramylibacter kogurei TaxID=1889778 RepID=A0A2G5K5W9_9RHOB|nr:pyruvate, phosphate dikinase [Amylibacter kogurei]PIB24509.1 pyruvate, phosphate dikinase [Amylibacter kogurei]
MDGSAQKYPDCIALLPGADVPCELYGARAASIVDLMAADLPVPKAWAFSVETVRKFARSDFSAEFPMTDAVRAGRLLSVRASAQDRAWGGPETLLNIGMNADLRDVLAKPLGENRADALYFRFIQDYAVKVGRLDAEDFEIILERCTRAGVPNFGAAVQQSLAFFEDETDSAFPSDPELQLRQALRSLAVAWGGTSAKILRGALGAPSDAGLGLIVQEMVLGVGRGEFGSGIAQFVSVGTGEKTAFGRYLSQSQGRDAMEDTQKAQFLAKDPRGPSLEEIYPEAFARLQELAEYARKAFCDDMQLEFTIEDGAVWLLDAIPAERTGRGAVTMAVRLATDGLITRQAALQTISPKSLNEILHPQISAKAVRDRIANGIGASPGAATGRMVFSATAAQASEARGEACILVRVETTPDDIRGMHSANGILTERGGITSHAAVVARGMGLPCVVGAADIDIDTRARKVTLKGGEVLGEGDVITLEGGTGDVLRGAPDLVQPELGGAFQTFMSWADEFRKLGVRGNADTPEDFRMAQAFGVDGIGLVRTEHMFFDEGRLTVMRELIFADSDNDRQAALNLLLPMQRDDFIEMFTIMGELPVCIRLLDPPLHEFLPSTREEMQSLAESMGLPLSKVMTRIDDLTEFNPMLGTRGVRLGITAPEIYEMQARGIFEAVAKVQNAKGISIKPEIMIPLVSAKREVELVKSRVDAVASAVQVELNTKLDYAIGVMVETPRAALRAGDIAQNTAFMSFGTNDLTQMTYGLSRDDAGRFMRDYVALGVFPEDPFHSMDIDGVGELIQIAVDRANAVNPDIKMGLCGEHGGDSASVAFCHEAGLDYVSCSPFRTPIARLAAAQAALNVPKN